MGGSVKGLAKVKISHNRCFPLLYKHQLDVGLHGEIIELALLLPYPTTPSQGSGRINI